jgi:NAD+ synthase
MQRSNDWANVTARNSSILNWGEKMQINYICDKLVSWLKEKVEAANAKGTVCGLSGGIDSAVVSVLCKKAFPETALCIIMPCHSDDKDERDARLVAEKFNIKTYKVSLDEVYDTFLKQLPDTEDRMAKANLKPRLRMATLYYYAAINNLLVVGATNKSEFTVGYFTKYGDSGVDLMPLANLVKTQVWQLAEYLHIPKEIIEKKPTAGLWPGQTDENELGMSYKELDTYILTSQIETPELKQKIELLNQKSEHKRKFAFMPSF